MSGYRGLFVGREVGSKSGPLDIARKIVYVSEPRTGPFIDFGIETLDGFRVGPIDLAREAPDISFPVSDHYEILSVILPYSRWLFRFYGGFDPNRPYFLRLRSGSGQLFGGMSNSPDLSGRPKHVEYSAKKLRLFERIDDGKHERYSLYRQFFGHFAGYSRLLVAPPEVVERCARLVRERRDFAGYRVEKEARIRGGRFKPFDHFRDFGFIGDGVDCLLPEKVEHLSGLSGKALGSFLLHPLKKLIPRGIGAQYVLTRRTLYGA